MNDRVEVSRESAEAAARLLLRFQDDAAIMRGYSAVRKMLILRVGDQHAHAEAFRRAFLEPQE